MGNLESSVHFSRGPWPGSCYIEKKPSLTNNRLLTVLPFRYVVHRSRAGPGRGGGNGPSQIFYRSVNPIATGEGIDHAHHITTRPSGFSNLSTAQMREHRRRQGRFIWLGNIRSSHEMFFFSPFFSFLSYLTPESNLCPVTLYSWLLLFEIFVSHERVQNCPN